MDNEDEDVFGGGYATDDDTDLPLDDDGLDVAGSMKFDEEEEDPEDRFH